ncbi:MAG: hypothetical protein VB143_01625 [Burkholderia sp.]
MTQATNHHGAPIAMSDPRNDDKNLWVGWGEYHRLVELLALAVHESGWKFDQLVVYNGGVPKIVEG